MRVVDARMNDAALPAARLLTKGMFLLEKEDAPEMAGQLFGNGKADHTCTYDGNEKFVHLLFTLNLSYYGEIPPPTYIVTPQGS